MRDKRVLLIIGGGIAAYKSLELIRMITKAGGHVTPVLTSAGAEFVTPLSVGGLAGTKAYTNLFDLTEEAEMGHIQLSRSADLVVVAPATADLMAKMATGQADDLASTLLLATDTPVMIAPAMNVRMWVHPATQRNLHTLQGDGIEVVGPNEGDMACGEFGPGRMAEPDEIFAAIAMRLPMSGPLSGRRIVLTAGPTHEPIDPVRYIANRSSGIQGIAIAEALRDLGAEVVLICGPVNQPMPHGVRVVQVETANQMMSATRNALPADCGIFAAAVADWRVSAASDQKMKKDASGKIAPLALTENPDILHTIAQLPEGKRPALVVGFAAETENLIDNAAAKRARKRCDWIVANDVSPETGVMGGIENTVTLITEDGHEAWERGSKVQVARRLALKVAERLGQVGVA